MYPFKTVLINSLILWILWIFQVSETWASTLLDRQFELETIGFIKSWDNVDDIFDEYITSAYKDYFSHQSHFILNDLSKANPIFTHSKIPYNKIIDDPEILGQLAKITRTESIIKTKILKQGTRYYFTLEWLHSPHMESMSTVTFNLEEHSYGTPLAEDRLTETLHKYLNVLFSRVPFIGHVTGRDHDSITLNLNSTINIRKNDILIIGTLDEVKKHPILKSIVDWKIIPTGKVRVEQMDEGIIFGKVIEEEPGLEISQYQQVMKILPVNSKDTQPLPPGTLLEESKNIEKGPHLGWVGVSAAVGNYNWQFSVPAANPAIENTGRGTSLGGIATAEIWLTKEWFANLEFRGSFWNFTQQDDATGTQSPVSQNGGVSGSLSAFKIDVGYSYLITGIFSGPKCWAKLGYKSNSFNLPSSITENTGPVSLSTVFLGVGGELPIREKWGAFTDLSFKLLSSMNQSLLADSMSGTSDTEFTLGASYKISPRMNFRAGVNIITNSASFSNAENLSQKMVTFTPSLLYYF